MENGKILIVEDAKELLNIWKTLFSHYTKYQVQCHTTGNSALAALDGGFCPDLLVTDYNLDDYNGLDLITQVKKRCPDIQIIMATGVIDNEGLKELAAEGAFKLFIKPLKFDTLRTATAELLAQKA